MGGKQVEKLSGRLVRIVLGPVTIRGYVARGDKNTDLTLGVEIDVDW